MHHVATSREVLDYSQKKKKEWRERYWTDPFLDKDVKLLSVERKRHTASLSFVMFRVDFC